MAETWKSSLAELKTFISEHPAIEIDPSCVVISGDIRPEFYKIFDRVRADFLKERFVTELEKAGAMSAAWAQAAKTVKEEMQLEDIEIDAGLAWFLKDPADGLIRGLFDPLFDLLKGKTDETGFVKAADAVIKEQFAMFFREGYERWATLALLHHLKSDHLWLGKTSDFYNDPTMEGDVIEGNRDDWVNDPVESKKLVFDNLVRASFVVPGALIHSLRLSTFVSLRPRWYHPRWKAKMVSERQDWVDLRKIYRDFGTGNLWPDLLINTAEESPDDLKLISDFYRIARPDVIVEFMEEDNWWDAKHVESIIRHNLVHNPRFGTFVISRVTVPTEAFKPLEAVPVQVQAPPVEVEKPLIPPTQQMNAVPAAPVPPPPPPMVRPLSLAELPENVHVISSSYDMSKLEPVAQALVAAAVNAKDVYLKSLEPR